MQVVGEVDDAEVLSVINDVGYLLNDTSLPMDDGQVQWPEGWRLRLCLQKPSHPEQHICYIRAMCLGPALECSLFGNSVSGSPQGSRLVNSVDLPV